MISRTQKQKAFVLGTIVCVAFLGSRQAPAGGVPVGRYDCSGNLAGVNFTLNGGGEYADVDGVKGRYAVTGTRIVFTGAALGGEPARYTRPDPPTIELLSERGTIVASCELAR